MLGGCDRLERLGGTRNIRRSGKPTDRVTHVFVHHVGRLVLKCQQHVAHERPRARQRFHDTRTLARVEFALVAVLKLLQCSTRQVVGILLEYLFLRGLDLGERRLDGDDERLGATEHVGLVGGNE